MQDQPINEKSPDKGTSLGALAALGISVGEANKDESSDGARETLVSESASNNQGDENAADASAVKAGKVDTGNNTDGQGKTTDQDKAVEAPEVAGSSKTGNTGRSGKASTKASGNMGALSALGLSVDQSIEDKREKVEQVEDAAQKAHEAQLNEIARASEEVAKASEDAAKAREAHEAEASAARASEASVAGDAELGSNAEAAETARAAAKTPETKAEAREEHVAEPADKPANEPAGKSDSESSEPKAKKKHNPRAIISTLLIVAAIPVSIAVGVIMGPRSYWLISVIILCLTMIPFFMSFERRKPQARELVVLAVMIALATASRIIFIWAPAFSPLIGIAIITALSLGPEAGFLTGSLSALLSNFVFGQGPWTPWQMFAYGIAPFIIGYLFKKGILKPKRTQICVVSALFLSFMVGPILDTCAVFTMPNVNMESVLSVYIAGIPYDTVHMASAVLVIALFGKQLYGQLERVKVKYGMMGD